MYCASRRFMSAKVKDSPARNVFSFVAPVSMFLSLERTNAAPLPGLTCRNSFVCVGGGGAGVWGGV